MTASITTTAPATSKWRQYNALTKPRVVQLIVFCAVIGMLLASGNTGWRSQATDGHGSATSTSSLADWDWA